MTFDVSEVRLIRAALVAIEHYMDTVWDETEVSAVSGYSVSHFTSAREQMRALLTDEDRKAWATEGVRIGLERAEMLEDSVWQGRRVLQLRAQLEEADRHGVAVSERLRRLAQ